MKDDNGQSPRERVRRRLIQFSKLAVIAAVPITNTACDPAPEPWPVDSASCLALDGEGRLSSVGARAEWVTVEDTLTARLELWVADGGSVTFVEDVEVEGGTGTVELGTDSSTLAVVVSPDSEAQEVTVHFQLACQGQVSDHAATLDVSEPVEGAEIPLTLATDE